MVLTLSRHVFSLTDLSSLGCLLLYLLTCILWFKLLPALQEPGMKDTLFKDEAGSSMRGMSLFTLGGRLGLRRGKPTPTISHSATVDEASLLTSPFLCMALSSKQEMRGTLGLLAPLPCECSQQALHFLLQFTRKQITSGNPGWM